MDLDLQDADVAPGVASRGNGGAWGGRIDVRVDDAACPAGSSVR